MKSLFNLKNSASPPAPSAQACSVSNPPDIRPQRRDTPSPSTSSPQAFSLPDRPEITAQRNGSPQSNLSGQTSSPQRPSLLDQITENLEMSEFDKKRFLPLDCLARIVCRQNIQPALPGAEEELLNFITQDAAKVFATVLRATKKSGNKLVAIMRKFHTNNFHDDLLPHGNDPQCTYAGKSKCNHHKVFDALHDKIHWDVTSVQDFFDMRWIFLAPEFKESTFRHDLAPNSILPFVRVEEDAAKNLVGGFSRVQKAVIHKSHQTILPTTGTGLTVAIKELQPSMDTDYPDPKTAWELELHALDGTRSGRHTHEHLTSAIAAFQKNGRYYLVFEWADGGSLQQFWEKNEKPDLSADLVQDVLEQLHGLSGALLCLHGGNPRAIDRRTSNPEANALGAEDDNDGDFNTIDDRAIDFRADEAGHWRHGDLKPANILRFRCPDSNNPKPLGTLQIADLGLARRHTAQTRDRVGPTSMKYGTVKYEGPEAHPMNAKSKPRTRLYDVWSMGCITLEFIIWLLHGDRGLQEFDRQTLDANRIDDSMHQDLIGTNFYLFKGGNRFEVNDIATYWMAKIQEKDPECESGKNSALNDLLTLVRTKLLVIETNTKDSGNGARTDPCRATASELEQELREMKKKGENDRGYLFTGSKRDKVVIPSKPRSPFQTFLTVPGHGLGIQGHQVTSQDSASYEEKRIELPAQPLDTQYTHTLNDTWTFIVDNDFALDAFRGTNFAGTVPSPSVTKILCKRCQDLRFSQPDFGLEDDVTKLSEKAQGCNICRLFYRACIDLGITGQIQLYRDGSTIRKTGLGRPVLSICRSPNIAGGLEDLQIGFPTLPEGGETRFRVLRQWLEHCNGQHDCHSNAPGTLPKRVIDVRPDNDADSVRLCETKSQNGEYVALSHRWGMKVRNPPFATTKENIRERLERNYEMAALPRTFQDAVTVTRALGIRYLWIDSICIIQGPDGDWDEQAKCMEDVFSSASCVVAATRASGTADGFLKPPRPRDFVTVSDGSANCLYVCEAIDDFDGHVTEAELNTRGWVFQERALARRTIHFAKEQTYWECGHGIRCESLTKMANSKAALLGDSDFPNVARNQSKGGIIVFFETFYKQYSRLALSVSTDRPVAIAGLEIRLIRALGVHGGYGIFDSHRPGLEGFLGRSLLWMRGSDVQSMVKINFGPDDNVPSWSWMAYEGGIDYLDVPFNEVAWDKDQIKSPWDRKLSQQSSWHTADRGASSKLTARARGFSDSADDSIIYDRGGRPVGQELKCVVIGRSKLEEPSGRRTHYVLIIGKRRRHDWERVGVGKLMGKDIAVEDSGSLVSIS
ncbi:serine threonine protein kinase [Diplodia corticola]|uniref:Serine threonine protein kinase n=1 Tax=Diplodia corticola TaxID=236234 RepID=A0A1J9RF45_9PEZI|nr:serine threonine protein kinase [Diplodia corticola]OJD38714.1 serine threonine protein kinase [Diplodia corticola]